MLLLFPVKVYLLVPVVNVPLLFRFPAILISTEIILLKVAPVSMLRSPLIDNVPELFEPKLKRDGEFRLSPTVKFPLTMILYPVPLN